ncbi:uncharacterized protein MONBRDRAFT_33567 [Monosiga brevicollis MX1]|uniref:Ribosomal protein L1 n=1 Tax=Monosiga brevicollis TaxID=81824 RepID=A9V641_MONBE|nr:uncharacterized protein MONBRDRAFT_33567 [Monosiga brevicollis MX1]EDQ87007.1 predicted protein [Monosiga brevicollis MX1]|eukprot:XP_001748246.1 hypothetical protein [Monosiga brevicollis MX1]
MQLDQAQVIKACKALTAYLKKNEDESLLDEERGVYMLITLAGVPRKPSKPFRIPLKHFLYDHDGARLCLIVKDPEEYFATIAAQEGHKNLTVIGYSRLEKEFKTHEARRQLLNSFDFFMADERVLPSMSRLLGTKFTSKKKSPVGVKLKNRKFTPAIRRALEASYFHLSGSSCSLRIGNSAMTWKQLGENVLVAMPHIIDVLPHKEKLLQAVLIQADNTIALPVWHATADELDAAESTLKLGTSVKTGAKSTVTVQDMLQEAVTEYQPMEEDMEETEAPQNKKKAPAKKAPVKKVPAKRQAKATNGDAKKEPADAATPAKKAKASPAATPKAASKPATPKAASKPATPKAASKPATPKAASKPATPKAASKPATPKAASKPATPKAASKPATPKAASKAATPKAASKPATPKAASKPATPKAASKPATPKAASKPATPKAASKAATPKAASKPATPKAASKPATLKAASKPATPKAASKPTTPKSAKRTGSAKATPKSARR